MSVEANKRIVQRVFDEAFNEGRLSVIDETTDGRSRDHQHPDEPSFAEHLKAVVTAMRTAFPDLHFAVERMIGEGDWVALHSTMTGTHTGPLTRPLLPPDGPPLIPATGRPIQVAHQHMLRFDGGRNAEIWHVMDTAGMMGQLGLMPTLPEVMAR